MDDVIKEPIEFEWDTGNSNKNKKHNVTDNESEEAFLDTNRFIFEDITHSALEKRYGLFGNTKKGKLLFIAFTIRGQYIRIISARSINRKEVLLYEKAARTTKVQK